VERGSLLPLSRRELAPGMAGKKRLTLARGGYRQAIASKLARSKRRQAAAFHMVLGREFAADVAGARYAPQANGVETKIDARGLSANHASRACDRRAADRASLKE
jgi:hypothetical protein